MVDYLRMKKVYTGWVPKFQRSDRVDYCEELLKNGNHDPTELLGRIVMGNET